MVGREVGRKHSHKSWTIDDNNMNVGTWLLNLTSCGIIWLKILSLHPTMEKCLYMHYIIVIAPFINIRTLINYIVS